MMTIAQHVFSHYGRPLSKRGKVQLSELWFSLAKSFRLNEFLLRQASLFWAGWRITGSVIDAYHLLIIGASKNNLTGGDGWYYRGPEPNKNRSVIWLIKRIRALLSSTCVGCNSPFRWPVANEG